MRKNLQRIKEVRESVGPDFPIMVDCYMALTVPYTIELIRKAEPYNVKWFEEFLPPDNYAGYAQVKEKVHCNGSFLLYCALFSDGGMYGAPGFVMHVDYWRARVHSLRVPAAATAEVCRHPAARFVDRVTVLNHHMHSVHSSACFEST
mgnify:CR=1 FL=1